MISKTLRFYIDMSHKLTFEIEDKFKDIYSYEERLIKFMSKYQDNVRDLRRAFLVDYSTNDEFRKEYHDYMNTNFDYIVFVNLNISAMDQRKFNKQWYSKNVRNLKGNQKPIVRFTAYWYQVILWEIYKRYSVAYWKSRDIGLSFSIIAGEAMSLLHNEGSEVIFMSRTEKDVDITGDRTQTNMGRLRRLIEDTVIYNLDSMFKDKHLMLYADDTAGVKGANINGAGRQGRFQRGFDDEAGAQQKVGDVVEAITMATTTTCFAGTLKPATDAGFRKIIKAGHRVENDVLRKLFDDFKDNIKDGLEYKEAFDKVFAEFDKTIPSGMSLSFTNTFKDHPLKAGECDYFKIESNRLLNDEVVISQELLADLNAGTPDRSFYSLTKEHHVKFDEVNYKDFEILMGFDPGSHGTAAMIPIIVDDIGRYNVLKAEIFKQGSMGTWLDYLIDKYGQFILYAEQSVKSYEKSGSGWMSAIRRRGIRTIIVSNRHPDDQLLVVNEVGRRKILDENGNSVYALRVDERNEWFTMYYISGEKYGGDRLKKEMSHPAEAMIAPLFQLNKYVLEDMRNEVHYG